MINRERVRAGIKLVLAISAAAIAYAAFASIYNAWAADDQHLEVISGAVVAAIAGSLSILLLWIRQLAHREPE